MSSYRIHTQIKSAEVIKAVGEVLIAKRWNQTSKQSAQERAILVPMEVVSAPEVPESFRVLVETVLRNQAQEVLKKFCEENPNSFEISAETFTRVSLTEDFLNF